MIGNHIKSYREQKGMNQEELAERLCVTRQAVSNWERGKTEPDIETLHKIADVLEVSMEELIYGTKRETTIIHQHHTTQQVTKNVTRGLSFGAGLAMVISYVKWQSIGWAILHGALNWIYVIYYIIKYGWS
ncbi:MAG: helix-turn-helix transcriptional regulator [Clostridia bacterium]|nr:helix-turn-helix transcriptional regulator [Clostridia bacterium]